MYKLKADYLLLSFTFLIPLCGFTQIVSLPQCKHQFIVIAHRGDHTNAPENTLEAYQHAIDAEADFVEIDLRTTKDGQLVIMHNASIEHMTGFTGLVKYFDFDSLRKIKIREELHPEWGLHLIPTFGEVLVLCKGKINIYLDFKEASAAAAYKEIVNAGMEKNIVVYINEPHQYADWRKTAPQMPLMVSLPKAIKTKQDMNTLLDFLKIDVVDGYYDEYNAETVLAAKEKKVPVWADIQSADEGIIRWDKALALGLGGLQTDHPKALTDYLKTKGSR
ncbi:MAG: glycerophosphodiester phosphodiesterase family protein [Ferruginibacter sp.]